MRKDNKCDCKFINNYTFDTVHICVEFRDLLNRRYADEH